MRSERGAVSVYAASFAVMLTCVALIAVQVAGLIRLRHDAGSAADLAALAATRASVDGGDPCAVAGEVARLNNAELVACHMDYDVATVTARTERDTWWGHRWAAEQKARAVPEYYLSG